ncbi:MAG: VWA domain-containing protein [Terriglobia bacterium]
MHTRRSFFRQSVAAAICTQGAYRLIAQQEEPTFSSAVNVVSVLATVRTKNGEIVQNLGKDDFTLTEGGRPQSITYFSRETNLPLILGLLIDTSGSQRMVLNEERAASYNFLEKVLRPDVDRTFLVHFDYRPEVLQNMTSSKLKLESALNRLTLPYEMPRGGGTTLYDAVYLCSNLITAKQTGRKAFILLTDGEDTSSRTSEADAIAAALRADTLIYSILFSDESFGGRQFGADGRKVLKKMSKDTGGGFFEVSAKQPLEATYRQLEEELRNQYSFGYTSTDSSGKGFRPIKITTHRRDLVVQARSGYYPTPPARR